MTFSLTWLPDVLEGAGLKVALVDGWKTRGRGDMGRVKGVLCHHTAGARHGNMPTLGLLIRGRSDLSGPLSQLGLGRDGTYYVIAAGRANHAGAGLWQGISSGNSSFIGIEAENTGTMKDFPWPAVQMDAYHRGVAAILRHIGKGAAFAAGHREYALPPGRKSDPLFDMGAFRASVAAILNGTAPPPPRIPAVEPGGPAGAGRPTLRRGDRHELVKEIQRRLGVEPVGIFGPRTEAAVRAFQRQQGMVPDGIVGPRTWAALDVPPILPPPAIQPGPAPLIRERDEDPSRLLAPAVVVLPPPADAALADAHAVLARVDAPRSTSEWDAELTGAVQRALSTLYLLNPHDDVDGKPGPRTRGAWAMFARAAGLDPARIDAASARRLVDASNDPASVIGGAKTALPEDFEFRRNRRAENRERSVAALKEAAKKAGLSPAQTAYVLATADHESDRFATLEEYASGAAYEGRADLGNTRPGDGRLFKGRGYVQLTGRRNYTQYAEKTGIRLVDFPVILMNWPALSAWVIIEGMKTGAYTGRRLDRYVNDGERDFRNARRVVNGLDQADRIAAQAERWLQQLA